MPEAFNAAWWLVDRHVEAGDGGRPALVCQGRHTTYEGLRSLTWRAANALATAGVEPGDRVVLVASDREEFVAAFLGALRLGAVAVPLSTMLTAREQAAVAADAGARALFATGEYADRVPVLAGAVAGLRSAIVAGAGPEAGSQARHVAGSGPGGTPTTVLAWEDLADETPVPPAATSTDTAGFWLYTSGTTGLPKGAVHSHGDLRVTADTYARSVLAASPGDRFLSVAKLFFAYGLGNSLTFPLAVGATSILSPDRPTPAGMAALIDAERPTLFFASPGFCAAMLDAGLPAGCLASVRLVVTAGETLPAELWRRFRDRFDREILDGIGSTEALHIFCSNHPGDVSPGTTGRPVAGYELRLLDDSDAPVTGPDVPGYLWVRGGSVAAGYWQRPEATAATFRDGWLCTGDVYSRTADGCYRFHGRNNDMLKVGGMWVSPAEVENVLLAHDDVSEAAVVGDRTADGLETAVAFVVPRSGRTVDPAALDAHCRAGMAAFKRPRRVVVVPELPKTATGKVQRYALRDMLRTGREAEPLSP